MSARAFSYPRLAFREPSELDPALAAVLNGGA
jgi:hypothetical protein